MAKAELWAVSAGKGGVGKSFVCSSLGITLAKLNFRVLIVDLDAGSANLHTTLGMEPQPVNFGKYLSLQTPLRELILKTPTPQLSILEGAWDRWSQPEVTRDQMNKVLSELSQLDFDYILLDLGPGATPANLEILNEVDRVLLVTTPEPTSIEKTYRFIEASLWDNFQKSLNKDQKPKCLNLLTEFRASSEKAFQPFSDKISSELGIKLGADFESMGQKFCLVVNEARSQPDQELGHSIKSVCFKFYRLPITYMGAIDYDNAVWQSVRSREAFLLAKPFTRLSGQFLSLAKALTTTDLHAQLFRAVI